MSEENIQQLFASGSPDTLLIMRKSDLMLFAEYLLNSKGEAVSNGKPAEGEWLNAKQTAERFGLAYNNVKSAKWRQSNGFPSHQPGGAYSTPMFNVSEVSEWLRNA